MSRSSRERPALVIAEFDAEYVVEGADAGEVRARYDRLVPRMADECAGLCDYPPEAEIVIEHLDIDVLVDDSADDAAIVREWAGKMSAAVREAITGPPGPGIVRFRDEPEHVAAFLESLVRGGERDDWRFCSLTCNGATGGAIAGPPRTRGALIAGAIRERPLLALGILEHLDRRGRLESVLAMLSADEIEDIARCLVPADAIAGWQAADLRPVAAVVRRLWPLLDRPLIAPANWIRMIVRLSSEKSARLDHGVAACVAAEALRLLEALEASPQQRPGGVATTMDSESRGAVTLDGLARLGSGFAARAPKAMREQLIDLVTGASGMAGPRAASQTSTTGSLDAEVPAPVPVFTHVGGFFLLIRDLIEAGTVPRLACLPSVEGVSGERLGLYLLALALAGPHVQQIRHDPGGALLAGLDAVPAPSILERAAAGLNPAQLQEARATSPLAATTVPHEDGPVLVVRDREANWFFAARVRNRLDAELCREESARLLGAPIENVPWAGEPTIERDVSHLFVTGIPKVPDSVHAAFAVLARQVVARFSQRLRGFEESSVPYVLANFLYGPSTVALEPEVIRVKLPRTPLQVVLRLYGPGDVACVPWIGNRRLIFEFS